jgi:hypothetical protein
MNTDANATTGMPASAAGASRERLEPLFPAELTDELRARWGTIQAGFVDDPAQAVRQADELVAQVLKGLAQSFAGQRGGLDGAGDRGADSTEARRVAFRRYRSFFERLLTL